MSGHQHISRPSFTQKRPHQGPVFLHPKAQGSQSVSFPSNHLQVVIAHCSFRTKLGWQCACVLSHFSCVQLFVTPGTVACQAPLSMGFSRQEYWSRLPFPPPGDLPDPGIEAGALMFPALATRFFTWEAQGLQGEHEKRGGARCGYAHHGRMSGTTSL